MGLSYRGLRHVASFRPYTSKQVGDTGPAESARRRNLRALGSSFSGARGTGVMHSDGSIFPAYSSNFDSDFDLKYGTCR